MGMLNLPMSSGDEWAGLVIHLSLPHFTWTMICSEAFSACALRKGLKNDTVRERARRNGVTGEPSAFVTYKT